MSLESAQRIKDKCLPPSPITLYNILSTRNRRDPRQIEAFLSDDGHNNKQRDAICQSDTWIKWNGVDRESSHAYMYSTKAS